MSVYQLWMMIGSIVFFNRGFSFDSEVMVSELCCMFVFCVFKFLNDLHCNILRPAYIIIINGNIVFTKNRNGQFIFISYLTVESKKIFSLNC